MQPQVRTWLMWKRELPAVNDWMFEYGNGADREFGIKLVMWQCQLSDWSQSHAGSRAVSEYKN